MALAIQRSACRPQVQSARPAARRAVVVRAAAAAGEVPDMAKRNAMNLLLLGGISLPVAGLAGPYGEFVHRGCSLQSRGGR